MLLRRGFHTSPKNQWLPWLRPGQPGPTPQGLSLGTCVVPTPGWPAWGRQAGWPLGTGHRGTNGPLRESTTPHFGLPLADLGHGPHRSPAFPPSPCRVSEMPQTRPSDSPGSSRTEPLQHPAARAPHPVPAVPPALADSQALRWQEAVPPSPPSSGQRCTFPPRGPFSPAKPAPVGSPGADARPRPL